MSDAEPAREVDAVRGGSVVRPPSFVLRRRQLFGLDFVDDPDLRRVAVDIVAHGHDDDGRLPVVVTPNVDYVVRLGDAAVPVRRVIEQARWCLPDGQPIVWASRLVGRPLRARLAGSSLVEALWTDPMFASVRVAVFASDQSIADSIGRSHPHARVVVVPRLSGDPQEVATFVARHVEDIAAPRPALVFVGLGFPKDQLLIDALLAGWPRDAPHPTFLAVGAAFEMLFGARTRAPRWMQRGGLEWFFRFVQEPRRLFVRYFVRDPAFVVLVAQEWRRSRGRSGSVHSARPVGLGLGRQRG